MNVEMFTINNNRISFNEYAVTVRHYDDLAMQQYADKTYYVSAADAAEWEVNQIPKHKLLELVSKEKIDISAYEWMRGIELKTNNHAQEITEIAAYGSLEAYTASLPETQDEFNMDMDYRLSKLELGI